MFRAALVVIAWLTSLTSCSEEKVPAAADLATDLLDARVVDLRDHDQPILDSRHDEGLDQLTSLDSSSTKACDPSLDLAPLQLAAGYCVVYCFPVDGLPNAFAFRDEKLFTYNARNTNPVDWQVIQWTIDPTSGTPSGSTPVLTFSPTLPLGSDKVFANEYLALSPGALVAVGYTVNKTYWGEIVWGHSNLPPEQITDATGNYDVVFLDDDSLLINGSGVGAAQEGQGIYWVTKGKPPRLLIKDLGSLSGHLALGPAVLYAGGLFGNKNQVYAFTRAEVEAAITANTTLASQTDGDLFHTGSLMDATNLGDDLLAARLENGFDLKGVSRIKAVINGSTIQPGAMEDIVLPGGALAIGRLAASGQQLGLMLRKGLDTEIAVIQEQ